MPFQDILSLDDFQPTLGPAVCHDCHAGQMYWFPAVGWVQRITLKLVMGVPVYSFQRHICTARDLPEQLRGK